jgi:hypothetical protein
MCIAVGLLLGLLLAQYTGDSTGHDEMVAM